MPPEVPVSSRRTRQRLPAHQTKPSPQISSIAVQIAEYASKVRQTSKQRIKPLPNHLSRKSTGLTKKQLEIANSKQELLKIRETPNVKNATRATLAFAQVQAGTAVCISPTGLLLTCAHCLAETPEEYDSDEVHCLIFAAGILVQARCVSFDWKRDLALLQITASQPWGVSVGGDYDFPYIRLSKASPKLHEKLVCIGHPAGEQLEGVCKSKMTGFDVLHISIGKFRGLASGQDAHDNAEIGALMHNCWTYWGHSGAPLVSQTSGELVGLHSSWDTKNGMRRGIALEVILKFLSVAATD
ncbi:trypsin-like serine protease [Microthyrium microscopicum]|uniref:Trypsin-like serine protease n=1 Tax=Microthyrium microscopicum TaxID=703497 RepID=A0A6A6U8L8_9PEZI|nr:trypsin-like serine protease [Microthyrium microscopicum]